MAVFLLPVTLLFTVYLLLYYASKRTPIYAYCLVFVTLLLTFGIVTLIPYDVYLVQPMQTLAESDGNAQDTLHQVWIGVYWSLFVLCWVVLPIVVNYEFAGEFTQCTRLRRALLKRLTTLIITIILLIIFIVYMAYKGETSK